MPVPKTPRGRGDEQCEADLAPPVCAYLTGLGYTVRSEVMDCDIAALRGEELLIVELKKTLSLTLIIQAAKRQRVSDAVYVAIPRPSNRWKWNAQNRGVQHLLRRLELGLIFVSRSPDYPAVDIVFPPKPLARRKRAAARRAMIHEMTSRSGDFNIGGSNRRKLATAYRENAVRIACHLLTGGPTTAKRLRELGTGPKTLSILYQNVYGWFERQGKGVYRLSPLGEQGISTFPELARRYLKAAKAGRVKSRA